MKPQHSNMTTLTITPDSAKWMLSTSGGNRTLNKAQVKRYASDMKSGSWILSGEPIIFGGDEGNPVLLDGHHRLHACIASGVSFTTDVRYGITLEAFKVMDRGRSRSDANVLTLAGHTNTTVLASTVRWVWTLSDFPGNKSVSWLRTKYHGATAATLLDWIEKNPSINDSIRTAFRAECHNRRVIKTVLGALHFITSKNNPELADAFAIALGTGSGLFDGDPRLTLRNRLVSRSLSARAETVNHMAVLHVYAWNAYIEGRKLNKMLWREGDQLPQIKVRRAIAIPS